MIECLEKQMQQQQQQQAQRQHLNQQQHRLQQHQLMLQHQQRLGSLEAERAPLDQVAETMRTQPNHYFQQTSLVDDYNVNLNSAIVSEPNGTQSQTSLPTSGGSELIGYYFGSISRETAEWILKNHGGHQDGAYLLRSSGPNDDFVLSLKVVREVSNVQPQALSSFNKLQDSSGNQIIEEVLHYKIVETEESFVALHGQVGDEKFATIDELIDKAQGVATKPRRPILRQSLESQILPPTYWGLTIDQVRLAILIKAKQWGFPLFSSLVQQQQNVTNGSPTIDHSLAMQMLDSTAIGANGISSGDGNVTTLDNETIRTLVYKSLHEFQPWFHGKISREEAEQRIGSGAQRDGYFLVRERDNFSYAMCISHKKTTKHYRIDVLSTGELAIQDGHKFTSLMALVSHYTIMNDGLWCALTEACPRPIQRASLPRNMTAQMRMPNCAPVNNLYCIPPPINPSYLHGLGAQTINANAQLKPAQAGRNQAEAASNKTHAANSMICANQSAVAMSIKAPIKEWLQTINHKWSQFMEAKNQQSLNSFLFGSSNPLNNHCRHGNRKSHHHNHHHHYNHNNCHHHQHGVKHDHRDRKQKGTNGQNHCRSCGQNQLKGAMTGAKDQLVPNMVSNDTTTNGQKLAINGNNNLVATNRANTQNCDCCKMSHSANMGDPTRIGSMTCARIPALEPRSMTQHQNGLNADLPRALLSSLPQSSGFTLDGNSFIGSPLFAVRNGVGQIGGGAPNLTMQQSLDSQNGRIIGPNEKAPSTVREEKLISPAQSISANLNALHAHSDIYGSEVSTEIINDRLPTNSSSSSSGNRPQVQATHMVPGQFTSNTITSANKTPMSYLLNNNCSYDASVANHCMNGTIALPQNFNCHNNISNTKTSDFRNPAPNQIPEHSIQRAGPIVCGQHAGPAYRYTNCQADEGAMRMCAHLRQINRAADDTHLQTPSTQLASRAAMSKFIQFQDGQCLRTHRDTKSIQMAYQMSRQHQLEQQRNMTLMMNSRSQNTNQQASQRSCDLAPISNSSNMISTKPNDANCELDLMDCASEAFEFKYDPKLIKSSSIETLCGGVDREDECFEEIDNTKTNSELVMSLQSFWSGNENLNNNILSPIPASVGVNHNEQANHNDTYESAMSQTYNCISTQFNLNELTQSPLNEELYSMKKKHDLDELTTSLLAELTTSLKAQIDLKNKRSGLVTATNEQAMFQSDSFDQQGQNRTLAHQTTDPSALVDEFDALKK